jgi:hypothetical protein
MFGIIAQQRLCTRNMKYARNIRYGELYTDADNIYRVGATFDFYEDDVLVDSDVFIDAYIQEIQQAIVSKVRGTEILVSNKISYDEAVELYNTITQNTELFFE